MTKTQQLSLLMIIVCALCLAIGSASGQKRVDCRMYPFAPICRGIMTKKRDVDSTGVASPTIQKSADYPDARQWSAPEQAAAMFPWLLNNWPKRTAADYDY
ncbi:elevenin-Vc1-like [Schistocerca americana]|uniref:elevenin-Vc1-like n=1 Tax=Schistocerca americana TaxID=7009 RepID=UPI001F4FED7A|nr:elevenin-Vc1-like [Schistocerca americana]